MKVRKEEWLIILKEKGIINERMIWIGIKERNFKIILKRKGVVIEMKNVILKLMVMKIYSVMV